MVRLLARRIEKSSPHFPPVEILALALRSINAIGVFEHFISSYRAQASFTTVAS